MTEENKSVKKFPNLRFPGFEGEWNFKFGNEIFDSISDKKHNSDLPILAITQDYGAIPRDLIDFKITVTDKSVESYKVVEKGDFIISLRSFQGGIEYSEYKGICSPAYIILRPSISIDRIFFKYYLKTPKYITHLNRKLEGIRDGKMISYSYFSDIALPLPSIEEQNKVSVFLSLIDIRIQTQRKIIEGLSLQKISIVKKLFENKIKFKTDNKTHSWERKKLSEISEEHLHKNPNNKYNEVFSVAKHKGVINQIEHLGRSFSAKEILHYKLVYPGDLVYTKSPTSDFPFGIIKQNRTGRIGVVSPLYCVFTPKTYALGYLLHEYFNSSVNTFNYLNPLVQKGAKNTMNINNEIFLNGASILLPMDEEEQKKIYELLLCLDEKINLETELLTQYENQKKYLLQNLFV
ncbi:restriction endonuclease subunit S [Elizabethkingia anophelis]|uniref:restriction endonuclease subunit S n=1 Tax=Elizabethkingia anophelis TaxID=1117645 RepID=UPI00136A006F|nr:restriction endonuclease subunit S [Elizabethkingia anophelis]MYY41439.1 restriction endonuclease subunit S [Elizabethkingia anophelis]